MKASTIVCAVLAGTFGFSSFASAGDWRGHNRRHDREQRFEQRHDRRDDRNFRQGYRAQVHGQRPVYQQPSHTYSRPFYRTQTRRFDRGGYLPQQYRGRAYYVNDWRAYPGLYAPPYGQQWISVDGEFLLVAVATGLIVNALLN